MDSFQSGSQENILRIGVLPIDIDMSFHFLMCLSWSPFFIASYYSVLTLYFFALDFYVCTTICVDLEVALN